MTNFNKTPEGNTVVNYYDKKNFYKFALNMTNINCKSLGLKTDGKLRLFQPGKETYGFKPVVEFFRAKEIGYEGRFLVSLDSNPEEIKPIEGDVFLTSTELAEIIQFIQNERVALLKFWSDQAATAYEFLEAIK